MGSVASAPGDVVVGCVNNRGGDVRIVIDETECGRNEHVVEFAAPQVPRTVAVDCASGGRVNDALAGVPVHLPLTIHLSGTCTETVGVSRDDVTLTAASPGPASPRRNRPGRRGPAPSSWRAVASRSSG